MPDNYSFEFAGTKEEFLKQLNIYPNNSYSDGGFYYFNDYIVKLVDDEIHFGVERAGHSGGQWFIPTITEYDGKITFNGTIKYIGPNVDSTTTEKSMFKKCINKIGEWLLYIVVTPFVLVVYVVVKLVAFFKWAINKILRRPTAKPKTTEEKLFDLMENHLNCTRQ